MVGLEKWEEGSMPKALTESERIPEKVFTAQEQQRRLRGLSGSNYPTQASAGIRVVRHEYTGSNQREGTVGSVGADGSVWPGH